ncbi:hypothetical protein ABXW85_17090, partial [Streptococcus suis]
MKIKKRSGEQRFETLSNKSFWLKFLIFFGYLFHDIFSRIKNGQDFREYGLTLYCGRQGAGKTMAMTEYLERMRKKYPKAIICTNFGYVHQTLPMTDWKQ